MKTNSLRKRIPTVIAAAILALTAAVLMNLAACTMYQPPPSPKEAGGMAYQEGVPGGVMVNTVEVSARVIAINAGEREVTLLASDGKKYPVKAGPEAVNFDQIRLGDLVKATVTEELMVYLEEAGTYAGEGAAGVVALAPKGAKPGGVVAQTTQVIATVVAIDRAERTATLRFDDGEAKTFPVRDDIDLSRYDTGERVVFRHTEMIAISVEKQ